MTSVLLLPGGLWDDAMDAEQFWVRPGILGELQGRGLRVLALDRPPRAPSWAVEVDHLTPALPTRPLAVVAGSNGCSAAVRLALAHPDRVERLLLAWPATANDPVVDAQTRSGLIGHGASLDAIDELLAGQTIRGVSDAELTVMQLPVGVLPSVPANLFHQRQTVDALCRLLPHAEELPGCPEPLHPDFPAHLDRLVTTVTEFVAGSPTSKTHQEARDVTEHGHSTSARHI
jgi:pimeloyl-ACP methyl ester carboxylesterase